MLVLYLEFYKIFQKIFVFLLISLSFLKVLNAVISSFKVFLDLWSAVLNIKADTTMAELENLAKHFKDKYGIECYQNKAHSPK
ncbi:hypothetical protein [Campylobacter sp.]|uniref:hypothetical protein n=1 Tax=Campylobacter sp. TaxID=205 RepID=UPI002AA7F828|nr:hypothetical protein [Campylobacter sp.]